MIVGPVVCCTIQLKLLDCRIKSDPLDKNKICNTIVNCKYIKKYIYKKIKEILASIQSATIQPSVAKAQNVLVKVAKLSNAKRQTDNQTTRQYTTTQYTTVHSTILFHFPFPALQLHWHHKSISYYSLRNALPSHTTYICIYIYIQLLNALRILPNSEVNNLKPHQ